MSISCTTETYGRTGRDDRDRELVDERRGGQGVVDDRPAFL
jgi:hypothetical protein